MGPIRFRFPPRRAYRVIGALLFFVFAREHATYGQENKLVVAPLPALAGLEDVPLSASLSTESAFLPNPPIVAPTPKPIPPKRIAHSRFALDRTAVTIGLVQTASEIFDGVTTKYFLHHCSSCTEVDPASRFFLGSHPTWTGMIAAGSIEAVTSTYVYREMRRSTHKLIRRFAPLVPLALTGIHIIEGSRNLPLKNEYYCIDPGYIVVGTACVLPPSGNAGGSGWSPSGRSRQSR